MIDLIKEKISKNLPIEIIIKANLIMTIISMQILKITTLKELEEIIILKIMTLMINLNHLINQIGKGIN